MNNLKSDCVQLNKDDARRIAYILNRVKEYIIDIGPRDLRGFEEEIPELFDALGGDDEIAEIMSEDNVVILDDSEIRWDVKTSIIENGGEKVIELSYGWTAGMTKEQIAELDEDDQALSHNSLLIDEYQALDLISKLAESIINLKMKDDL